MKTYIINVSTNEFRRNRMLELVSQNKCLSDYFFIHDGDLNNISDEILNQHFGGLLSVLCAAVSCAYKHILAYKHIVNNENEQFALVLEDDIYLDEEFCSELQKAVNEIKNRGIKNFIISLEDSNLKFVKGSERKKDVMLYKQRKGRMAGAYLIDKEGARSILAEIEQNRCNMPIDWFHNYCEDIGLIYIYWIHPTIATQGSLNGKIKSIIDNKYTGTWKQYKFRISKVYKKLLYRLR